MASIDDELLAKLRRQLLKDEQRRRSLAQGEAAARGLSGGTTEGRELAAIGQQTSQQLSDAELAVRKAREDEARQAQLLAEERAFQEKLAAGQQVSNEDIARAQQRSDALAALAGAGGSVLGGLFSRREAPPTVPLIPGTPNSAVSGLTTLPAANTFGSQLGSLFTKTGVAGKLGAVGIAGTGAMALAKYGQKKGGTLGSILANPIGAQLNAVKSIGKKIFCFDSYTPVVLEDGQVDAICNIEIGDKVKGGGRVISRRESLVDDGDRFYYRGVMVTGYHAVHEDGKWLRVQDSKWALPIAGAGVVYSITTENHRMWVNNIEFADDLETPLYETLSLSESIDYLNSNVEGI